MDIVLFSDLHDNNLNHLLGETIGMAILDSGCTRTVCGNQWLDTYLDTLSTIERKSVFSKPSVCSFRFGDGQVYDSNRTVVIPIHFGSQKAQLEVNIVSCNVPLLLSRLSLKRANSKLDFSNDKINILGEQVPIHISNSGHYCISLSRTTNCTTRDTEKIFFTSPVVTGDTTGNKTKVLKLHKQFAHPAPEKLKKLIRNSGSDDPDVYRLVDEISKNCDVCKKFKPTPLRPAVGFPVASSFNETVAMDLKSMGNNLYILHMIDHATRYSSACLIRNKKKETIIKAVMEYWIRIFGAPGAFLTDNGGEFVNDQMLEYAEQFNIILHTTAAESAWSNGLCEKHNGIIADMIYKIRADSQCDLELAVHWGIAAKNSLMNVYGFSPNELVFGQNVKIPSNHTNKLPALSQSNSTITYIRDNLRALHAAREAFIQQEACERLRRALCRKTRSYSNTVYNNGDSVYYHRNNAIQWHGPAKVLGRDGQQYLLKHGGIYIRVHPCRMQHATQQTDEQEDDTNATTTPTGAEQDIQPTPATQPDTSDEEDVNNSLPTPMTPQSLPPTSIQGQIDSDELLTDDEAKDNTTIVKGKNDLPSKASTIIYRHTADGVWHKAVVLGRAGKASANNWHYMNIKDDDDNDKCVSFQNSEWKNIDPDVEDIYYGNTSDGSRFLEAKQQELQKWKDLDAYEEVEDTGQRSISCRWVCTEKKKDSTLILKARLVARGFEENTVQLQTDSPTCHKESLRLLLCILASNSWTLHSLDIKSVYLQGTPISRTVYLKPPTCANTIKLWKLKKCPYGLVDAGRNWYFRVRKELLEAGAYQSHLDQATFCWFNKGKLCGLIIVHVDDFLFGGTKEFHSTIINKLRSTFAVGSEENTGMKYLGLHIHEDKDSIVLSAGDYSLSCKEISLPMNDPQKDVRLSCDEKTLLKQLSGQLNWITTQCRPDMAFENCLIGNSIKHASTKDITFANKALRKLKCSDIQLRFPRGLDLSSCSIVVFCDASFANLPDKGSQGAHIIFLVDNSGRYCVLNWQSRRIRRVVNSTIAAECLAALDAAETSVLIRATLKEYIDPTSELHVPISVMCDNKSLVEAIHSSTMVENKRLQIDISVLRDMLQNQEINELRWISTSMQVANPLTKTGCSLLYLMDIMNHKKRFIASSGSFE